MDCPNSYRLQVAAGRPFDIRKSTFALRRSGVQRFHFFDTDTDSDPERRNAG